jgi:integrase/recombinase XerC
MRNDYVARDPFDGVRMPKVEGQVVTAFTADDLRKMLTAARNGRNGERDFTIILVLYDTAMRAGELASLTLDQVDFDGGWLRIRGKGAKERLVPLGQLSKPLRCGLRRPGRVRPPRTPAMISILNRT